MKTNEMNTAKKLSLDEIKAQPRGTALWVEMDDTTPEGICWYSLDPVVICEQGPDGCLIGGNRDSYIDLNIDDQLLELVTVWDREPLREQLTGISQEEYDALKDEGLIVFTALASAITSKGMTFEQFCDLAGLNYEKFWKALTGRREFVCSEMTTIRNVLELTADEVKACFFPELMAKI